MLPLLQPNSFWKGSMNRLGMERTPADTSSVTKVTASTNQP